MEQSDAAKPGCGQFGTTSRLLIVRPVKLMCRTSSAPTQQSMPCKRGPPALRDYLVLLCVLCCALPVRLGIADSGSRAGKPYVSQTGAATSLQPHAGVSLAIPLISVRQVKGLTPAEAARHLPVRLRGVVTAFSGWRDYFFLQDATGGLAINREEHGLLQPGDEVELTGVSDPGLFSTSVISKHVQVLGRGVMPTSRLYSYSDLEGGAKDAEWVKVSGVVQSAQVESIWNKSVLVLGLEMSGQQTSVRVFGFDAADVTRFTDALVQVEGVCGTAYNDKRQFIGLRLFVGDTRAIKVLERAPDDPYAVEASPIRTIMGFRPDGRARHRSKITGIVTYQETGHSFYLQNGSDGIRVATTADQYVPVGASIEAIGFPALGEYSPVLTNASFRVLGLGNPISPTSISAAEFLQYKDTFVYAPYDGQLVRLQGTIVSQLALPNEDAWLMRDDHSTFVASLRLSGDKASPLNIAVGTTMSVTGVMSVTVDSDHQPNLFRILLRGPQDLVLVKEAPWWTPLHLFLVLGVLLISTIATVLWTVLLRRQVKRQTHLLRESEGRFRTQAQQDTLTGVASRSYLLEQLEAAVLVAQQTGSTIALLMLDLDHFKEINDTLGHHAGDQLLCIVANRIRSVVRRSDIVARMGGDEFVILTTGLGHESQAEAIGAKLVAHVAVPAEIAGQRRSVSASVGVCIYPEGGVDGDALLQHVDEAMYRAKAKGRDSCCVYTPAA
jgi:diguanylate cyclase (GGDEF)-like protein